MKILFKIIVCLSLSVSTYASHTDCKFSNIEIERLKEFIKIKEYLTKNVFQTWTKEMPQMYLYDLDCQYILNYSGPLPEGFSDTQQNLDISVFSNNKIFSRSNKVKTPFGEEINFHMAATGFTTTTKDGNSWLTFALYDVWKNEFGDKQDFFYGMLAHEVFHPFQFKIAKLKPIMDSLSESTFSDFYKNNREFKKMIDQEIDFLKRAILSKDKKTKIKNLKEFFKIMELRRGKYFINDKKKWNDHEPVAESIEGVAEYMNFRVITDSKTFSLNKELEKIDSDYTNFSSYKNTTFENALSLVSKTKSYTQKIGVYEIILLNQFSNNWQSKIFEVDGFAEAALKEFINN